MAAVRGDEDGRGRTGAGPDGSEVVAAAQVRIRTAGEAVAGAGFLVDADLVCTCAHVVARALGVPYPAGRTPDAGTPVELDFPLLRGRPRARARVVSWRHGGADVALLRLDAAVDGARPVPLADGTGVWGHSFRALGHPVGADQGVWVSGTLRAGQGEGWVQMETREPGPRITEGFSGAPVWDDVQHGVVGMTVAAHRGASTAYLLPSADLVDEEVLRPRCPFRGLAAFTADDAGFFHGRDDDIARVLGAVRRRPVTLVAGPSGCGKSSLVGAGVLPRLRAGGTGATTLRPVPGVRPSAVLARALTGLLEPGLGEVARLAAAEELARLTDAGADVPAELRARVLARTGGPGHVLFVDQFEEYAGADPAAGRDLFALLVALAGREGEAVLRVVTTARPDALDSLLTPATSDLVSDAVQFLAPLTGDDLLRAVTAPVDALPGLWFEPGLPERIVADAGEEPGRMPLVQFALTELWRRRARGTLTHAAYDGLGGVAGALVGYADQVVEALPPAERALAPRLLVQLARPTDGDGFARRPARTADLAPHLADLARKLATPGKLVVLSRPPGGTERDEIADLAHEALTAHWPLLRRWLTDSRDFRRWQEQLRADLDRWEAQDRGPARLLTGTDLTEAVRRTAGHPDDVTDAEAEYVRLSLRHARRGARVRRAAVAALAALTVLAVVLAGTTYTNLRAVRDQLRTQAAGLLAQRADDRPADDPATALQLALAAWRTKDTRRTRQALMNQYARAPQLLGAYPSLWKGRVAGAAAGADGRVLLVRSSPTDGGDRSRLTVITGAPDGKPRSRELADVPEGELLTAVSPDGRYAAAVGGEKTVRLWRTDGSARPRLLRPGGQPLPSEAFGALDFSSDGERLLLMLNDNSGACSKGHASCVPSSLHAWETGSGDRLPVPVDIVAGQNLQEAAFTSDPDTVVTVRWEKRGKRAELRDLTTGRSRHVFQVTEGTGLRAGGEALLLTGDTPYLQELGRGPGRRVPWTGKGSTQDATLRYETDDGEIGHRVPAEHAYEERTLVDARTRRTYRVRVPTAGKASYDHSGLTAAPREDGGLTVLVPVGTTLLAVRAEPTGPKRFTGTGSGGRYALSPDGRYVARVDLGRLEMLGVSRERHADVPLDPERADDLRPVWTADARHVVLWDESGPYRAYPVAGPGDGVPLPRDGHRSMRFEAAAALTGGEIVFLTRDGTLVRVDAADPDVRHPPFPVHPGPNHQEGLPALFRSGQLAVRPGHPGQVAVVTVNGARAGEILLWDVRAPRRLALFRGPRIEGREEDWTGDRTLAFDAGGDRLAVRLADGRVRVWDVDGEKPLGDGARLESTDTLAGFGSDGALLSHVHDTGRFRIHDRKSGDPAVTVPVTGDAWLVGRSDGRRLTVETGHVRQTFALDPGTQFRTLCAAVGRDYTEAERALLPEGTPDGPPCS